jgi:hypothetical protein
MSDNASDLVDQYCAIVDEDGDYESLEERLALLRQRMTRKEIHRAEERLNRRAARANLAADALHWFDYHRYKDKFGWLLSHDRYEDEFGRPL